MEDEFSSKTTEPSVVAQLKALVAEAKQGHAEVLPQIRRLLHAHPQIRKHLGNLAGQVEAKWIGLLAGEDACVRESLIRRVNEWRLKLRESNASPLEQLLVERIVTSWLQVRFFDTAVALATEGVRTTQARFMDQQLHRAEKRHSEAIKALAEVRKLLPVVQ